MIVDGKNVKYLPYSGRRYLVGVDGSIYHADGSVVELTDTEEGLCVNLAWLDGVKLYPVGQLVIVSYHPIYLPEHLWNEIEPLYFDDNYENNNSNNLTYRFKSGLVPYEEIPSFFYIPHFTKYVIDRYGNMRNAVTGKEKGWFQVKEDLIRNSKGGYWCTRVVNTPGVNSILLRHRALCLTFKPIENAHTLNLIVNHKDGIPGNDDLDNLEWSTYAKNNQHAHDNGLTGNRRTKVLAKNLKTESITVYSNTKAAAKALGYRNTIPVRYRIRHKPDTFFDDYIQLKLDDGADWLPVDITAAPEKCYVGEKMAARDVFTGNVVVFSTLDEGSKLTGIDKQTIMIHLRDRQYMPFKGYNFGYYTEDMKWPEHTDWHLKAYNAYPVRTPDPIILTDTHEKKEHFFESRNELASFLGVSQSYATQLTVNGWTYQNRYKPRYYNLRDNIQVPSNWKV